ncbi:hypothetical protein DM292_12930 [Stutzerimonas frequens]|nr:hypothetical protein DM292_12930 [Stutzerimonas frequens]
MDETRYRCYGNGGFGYLYDVNRKDTNCVAGQTYDFDLKYCVCPAGEALVNGRCEVVSNQCEATNGQTVNHEHLMKAAVGQPTIDPPGSVCGNGCQYAFTYTPASNVYVYTSGNPPGVFGVYAYTGNGIECNESTLQTPGNPSEGDTQDPDDTPPPEDGDKCPEGYTYNGTFCSPNTPSDPDPTDPSDPTDPTDPTDPGDGSGDGGSGGGGSGDGGSDGGSGDGDGSGDGGDGDGDGGSGSSGGGDGGTGTGDGEGEDEEGEGSGPGFCDGGDCSFVAPTYFDGAETIPGFEQSLAHVFDGIRNSPLGSAVGAISFPSGSGACPSGTVTLFGKPITFDGHCALWGEISGIFSALMLAVWCLLGVRIVLSS